MPTFLDLSSLSVASLAHVFDGFSTYPSSVNTHFMSLVPSFMSLCLSLIIIRGLKKKKKIFSLQEVAHYQNGTLFPGAISLVLLPAHNLPVTSVILVLLSSVHYRTEQPFQSRELSLDTFLHMRYFTNGEGSHKTPYASY